MSRLSLTGISMLMGAAAVVFAASIMALLPGDGVIPGWSVVAGADAKGCTAQDFYRMYDGAAPDMMQAGIIGAGQRVYRNDSKRLTVDIFRFASWQQTKAYYVKRRNEISTCPDYAIVHVKQQAALARSGRTTVCYLWGKQYCAALSVNGTSAQEAAALRSFAVAISRNIAALP